MSFQLSSFLLPLIPVIMVTLTVHMSKPHVIEMERRLYCNNVLLKRYFLEKFILKILEKAVVVVVQKYAKPIHLCGILKGST